MRRVSGLPAECRFHFHDNKKIILTRGKSAATAAHGDMKARPVVEKKKKKLLLDESTLKRCEPILRNFVWRNIFSPDHRFVFKFLGRWVRSGTDVAIVELGRNEGGRTNGRS